MSEFPANATKKVVSRNLKEILQGIKSGTIKNIVTLTGAGISCNAGIPDFRSPGGLYATLQPELLTASTQEKLYLRENPTGVVEYRIFQQNQFPYLEVRRPFILGTVEQKWKPTLCHFFIKLLDNHGILRRHYTQNIDGLEKQLSLSDPDEKIVHVHGCIGEVSCEACSATYPTDQFRQEVATKIRNIYDAEDPIAPKESSNICCLKCGKPQVKPSTVLYGRNLPQKYFESVEADFPENVDAMFVIGTSLTVFPACSLVNEVNDGVPRIILNRDRVGDDFGCDFGEMQTLVEYVNEDIVKSSSGFSGDALILGDCDLAVLLMAKELGWLDELKEYAHLMCPTSAALLESYFRL